MAKEKEDKLTFKNMLVYGSILTFLISFMSALPGPGSALLLTSLFITVLYIVACGGLTLLLRAISSSGQNLRVLNITTAVACLIVPLIMAQQEWDDHDRSKKTLAPDLAKDYLESCAKDAVIFTFGDNDTYPLWYAQEVEGVRPDIRIINNSLLGIDWYINQLRYKVNDADSLDVMLTPEQIEGHNREFVRYRVDPKADPNAYYDLYNIIKNSIARKSEDPGEDPKTRRDVGYSIVFPVAKLGVPVDSAKVIANGTVNPSDKIVPVMRFDIPQDKLQSGFYRSDLVILSIIASNKWERPIYFTMPYGDLGFAQYLRKDGLAYRLVPVQTDVPFINWTVDTTLRRMGVGGSQIRDNNDSVIYKNLMEDFLFGGAGKKNVYFDEENRRHLLNIRDVFAEAAGNLADKGQIEKAKELLDKVEAGIDTDNMPYGMVSRYASHNRSGLLYLEACYKAGYTEIAQKVNVAMRKALEQERDYYQYLSEKKPGLYEGTISGQDAPLNRIMLETLDAIEKRYAPQSQQQNPTEGGQPIINLPGNDSANKNDSPK